MTTFGHTGIGGSTGGVVAYRPIGGVETDYIQGLVCTCLEAGVADSITANIIVNEPNRKAKCAIYDAATLALVGVTDEVTPATYYVWYWQVFPFSVKPTLSAKDYILVIWGTVLNGESLYIALLGPDTTTPNHNATQILPYNSFPNPYIPAYTNGEYSIYATYTPSAAAPKGTIAIHAKLAGII